MLPQPGVLGADEKCTSNYPTSTFSFAPLKTRTVWTVLDVCETPSRRAAACNAGIAGIVL